MQICSSSFRIILGTYIFNFVSILGSSSCTPGEQHTVGGAEFKVGETEYTVGGAEFTEGGEGIQYEEHLNRAMGPPKWYGRQEFSQKAGLGCRQIF